MTLIIVTSLIIVLTIGFITVRSNFNNNLSNCEFAIQYRDTFVKFANKYFQDYSTWNRMGDFDNELYIWLTENVSKMQIIIGGMGIMDYVAPFQIFRVPRYQVILNTIPKFRDGSITNFDVTSVDDCLIRYIGSLKEILRISKKNLFNPFIWFRIGVQEIISIPLLILFWLGIFSSKTLKRVKESTIYKVLAGFVGLLALVSSIITIIVGKDQAIAYIHSLLGRK